MKTNDVKMIYQLFSDKCNIVTTLNRKEKLVLFKTVLRLIKQGIDEITAINLVIIEYIETGIDENMRGLEYEDKIAIIVDMMQDLRRKEFTK